MPGRTKKTEEPSEDTAMDDALPAASSDGAVENAEANQSDEAEDSAAEEPEAQRVRILPGSTDTAASFEFIDEGHTMGNALRYVIMKNPDVEFCAYAIPHPSEAKMNFRIQTYDGPAVDALRKGLADLQDVCDVVTDEFTEKRRAFNADHGIDR